MQGGELVGGRYRLADRLGRGGMGQVFRATDERLRREVAVKLVDLTATTDRTVAERFHREAIATAQLNHPGIVTIFDAGSDARSAWLVMELLPGRSVAELLASGPLAPDAGVGIARQVAEALVATHAIGVVHRDIKPANIMVHGRSVKLLDFGIALVQLDADAHLTAPATTLGTAAYMSPEQAQGQRASAASDVYALGGVLVAMLTGEPPYPGANAIQVAARHINQPPPSVRARRPDVPAPLDDLVQRMMAKNPLARPTASVVAQALAHLADNPGATPTAVLPAAAAAVVAPATAVLPTSTAVLPAGTQVLPSSPPATPASARRPAVGPDAAGPSRRPLSNGFRRVGVALGVLIAALLVFMVAWAVGANIFRAVPAAAPASATPSATPTPPPRTTSPPTAAPTRTPATPPVRLPSLPSARDAALRAAMGGVDATLATLPTDTARQERTASALRRSWAQASADILADRKPASAIAKFSADVDRQRDDGDLSRMQAESIKLALRGVQAVVGA